MKRPQLAKVEIENDLRLLNQTELMHSEMENKNNRKHSPENRKQQVNAQDMKDYLLEIGHARADFDNQSSVMVNMRSNASKSFFGPGSPVSA